MRKDDRMKATTKRDFRRLVGPQVTEILAEQQLYLDACVAMFQRGFFGRLKWLLFGR